MRWVRGAVLAIGLVGGVALAQQKPSPLEAPVPGGQPAAPSGKSDKFGEPAPQAVPAVPAPADELPAVARLRALLGERTALAYRAAEPIDPATGSLRLLGATLTRDDSRMAIEELTLDGLGERRIGAASARDVTLTGPESGRLRIARLELRGLTAPEAAPEGLALDSLRLESLTAEGEQQVALAELVLEDYAAGRPGRLTLAGLDVLAPQAGVLDRVRVGRIALRGLDLPGTVAALAAQETPPRATGGYALEVEEVAATLGDRPVGALSALRLQGDPIAGEIESGRLALRELRLEPSPGLEDWLRRFGYAGLVADLTAESRYDRARGRLELGSLSLAGREMGVLGLSLVLDGVTPEAAEAQDWEQLRLVGLTLRYLDQSLYGRAVRDQARRMKQPEAKLREQLASQAAAALSAGPGRGPGPLGPVIAAVQRFLRGEARELEITAKPPQPVAFGEVPPALIGGPAEAQRLLGLGAVAR